MEKKKNADTTGMRGDQSGHRRRAGDKVAQGGSGSPESQGGSRQGNAGHESAPMGGKGDRQG